MRMPWIAVALFTPLMAVTALAWPAPVKTQPAVGPKQRELRDAYGKLPLAFEANHGQTGSEAQFLARGAGHTIFLTASGPVISMPSRRGAGHEGVAVRMRLTGANPSSPARALDPLPGVSNYFFGNDPNSWHAGVPQYGRIAYTQVYPGVDLIYYGNQRRLEYDFVVAPGADPSAIRWLVEGAQKLRIDRRGDLIITTGAGEIRKRQPRVYQEADGVRTAVRGRYVLRGRELSFRLGRYDRNRPVIIDPTILGTTLLDGAGNEIAFSVTTDSAGNIYTAGQTTSTDFPTISGAFRSASSGGQDVFVAKLNPDLTQLMYSTYLGGSGTETARGIRVDAAGNAYVAGTTNSPNFPTTTGAFQTIPGGGICSGVPCDDAFVAKLNPTGSALVYSTLFGGNGGDQARSMALDASNNVYITGQSGSTNLPTTAGVVQRTYAGIVDAFLAKVNPQGSGLVYATYLGGSNPDAAYSVQVDAAGNAYVAGLTLSNNFPTTAGAFQPAAKGGTCNGQPCADAFVTKVNPTGTALVYSTYLGGTGDDIAVGLAVNANGSAYVTGLTSSTNFPTSARAFQRTYGGGTSDAFVSALDSHGQALLASTYVGGRGSDIGETIALLPSGSVAVSLDTTLPGFSPRGSALRADVQQTPGAIVGDLLFLDPDMSGEEVEELVYVVTGDPQLASSVASLWVTLCLAGEEDLKVAPVLQCVPGEDPLLLLAGMQNGMSNIFPRGSRGQGAALMIVKPDPPPLKRDFTLTKSVTAGGQPLPKNAAFVDQELTYNLTLTNTGMENLTVDLTDKLIQIDPVTKRPVNPPGRLRIVFTPADCHLDAPNALHCPMVALPVGKTVTISYRLVLQTEGTWVNTATGAAAGLTRNATATVQAFTPGPSELDISWKILTGADTSKTPPQVPANGNMQYQITVTNKGPALAAGVQMTHRPPAGMAEQISASLQPGNCLNVQGEFQCNLGTLLPGDSITVTFTATRMRQGSYRLADTLNTKATATATGAGLITVKYVDPPIDLQVVQGAQGSSFTTVSAASGGGVASGSIASGYGQGLSRTTEVGTSTPLPTKLAGTSIFVRGGSSGLKGDVQQAGGTLAPLFFVSPGQINYLIPEGTPAGTATLTVTNDDLGLVATGTVEISAVAPSLFSANASGRGVAAAIAIRAAADGTQTVVPVFQCAGGAGSCTAVPMDLGQSSETLVVLLFGTGIRGASRLQNVTATVGGQIAPVLFAGPQGTFVGLDQINLQIPRTLAGRGEIDVVLTVDGKTANTVTISVR